MVNVSLRRFRRRAVRFIVGDVEEERFLFQVRAVEKRDGFVRNLISQPADGGGFLSVALRILDSYFSVCARSKPKK